MSSATTDAPEPVSLAPPAATKPVESHDMERFLSLLHPDGCFEIRIPDCPAKKGSTFRKTASGYFVSRHDARKHIEFFANREPAGIYCTMNPVDGSLLGRSCNAITHDAKSTTTDADIVERRWILVDIDPKRPTGTSASADENKAAIMAAAGIRHWLAGRGWPEPLRCMSGNGAYLIYRVSLPNDKQAKELAASFLKVIGDRFNSERVDIDHSVYNAGRILKVCGTVARKGSDLRGVDGIEDRPHRRSFFIDTGKPIEVGDRSLIESLVAEFAERKDDAPETVKPTASQVASTSPRSAIDRCRKYLASMQPAIEGQNGSAKTLEAGAVVERFGLSLDDGLPLMHRYNARCVPPWDERDLERKLTEGMRVAREAGETERMLWDDRQLAKSPPLAVTASAPEYRAIAPGERVHAGDRGNVGTVESDDGDTCSVLFVSKEGNEKRKSLPKSELRAMDGTPLASTDELATDADLIVSAADLIAEYPALREPIIQGVCRRGETVNIIGAPKLGKSWFIHSLLLSVASGRPWLGRFETKQGPVLLIDNELHRETLSERLLMVATTMGVPDSVVRDNVDVLSLRGKLTDVNGLRDLLSKRKERGYHIAALDAFYRALPSDVNENDNAQMAGVYNAIDAIADSLGCGFVLNHHSSKGDQSSKSVTDVGSGAGSISRAADTHIILRPHREDGHAVMDGVCRSFRPFDPMSLHFDFPMFRASDLEPEVRLPEPKQASHQRSRDRETDSQVLEMLRGCDGAFPKSIRADLGFGTERIERALKRLYDAKKIYFEEKKSPGNGKLGKFWFATPPE
ncbi:AAA family ATPase [Allorhodopirellula solitaria]|uniref:Regulatory protein RepA n=1 Tax=Allorhodopirellula solitaria TaxID=2527987 RepID=A0A5C5YG27_9BACT|nr:AAA family ATPase [Allorhodopirellula solitaria]TWT73305.1 hypothetical protein CA85_17730 [Allorhodopirellula solitaria]